MCLEQMDVTYIQGIQQQQNTRSSQVHMEHSSG